MIGNVNDPNGYTEQLKYQLSECDKLDSDADAKAIRAWASSLTSSFGTRVSHIHRVRLLSERSDTPLTEWSSERDLYALLSTFEDGSHPDLPGRVAGKGMSQGTLRQYRQSARLFFRDGLGREWGENIVPGAPPKTRVTREDLLTSSECSALLDAAERARDKAIIATLLATGQRRGAMLSLRVRDFEPDGGAGGRTAAIRLNDEAIGLKRASGPRPLVWASEHVKNWYTMHPKRDDPDAPLFCCVSGNAHKDAGDPLSARGFHRILMRVAEKAGVDPDKVNPHSFRHTAITRMAEEGLSEQQIKFIVGWDEDSAQFKRYVHLKDEEMMRSIEGTYGYEVEEDDEGIGKPEITECPRCNAVIRSDGDFCAGCGAPLTQRAERRLNETEEQVEEDIYEGGKQAVRDDDEVSEAAIDDLRELLRENPDLVKELIE